MSHYMLQKMIEHTWMNRDYYKTRQREDKNQETCSLSSITTTATSTTSIISSIYYSALNTITLTLKCIMNRSLNHWPLVPSRHHIKNPNFQLHYWATRKRKYSNVEFCKDCNVSIFTDNCFEFFHTTWYLENKNQARKTDTENELEMEKSNTVSVITKKP